MPSRVRVFASIRNLFAFGLLAIGPNGMYVSAQEIGPIEKFALSDDRTKFLKELIPGSEEHFYYHVLHYQNEGRLAEGEAMLQQWARTLPLNAFFQRMQTRQRMLEYSSSPEQTLTYLRNELGLALDHAPPQADRAQNLPTSLDPSILDQVKKIEQLASTDPSLNGITNDGLPYLIEKDLPIDTVRVLLRRLTRVDLPGVLALVEKELKGSQDKSWGTFPIHDLLTLSQRQQLIKSRPSLLENDAFVRRYLLSLQPSEDTSMESLAARRKYLQSLEDFAITLPPSQTSLLANILFHRLQLDLQEEIFDRARFEKYLSLPRRQPYYNQELLKAPLRSVLVELQSNYETETRLPPVRDDSALLRKYLEHFFQNEASFSKWLDADYLSRVMIETKILYGIGDSATWYAKLSSQQQKEIRERVELRFVDHNKSHFMPDERVALTVDVKNVPKLIYRVYQINPRNVFRRTGKGVSTDLDLDGLVANSEKLIEYTIPADRRHREKIELEQCQGRGVWIIDLLGGGLRSRALVAKGQLRSTQVLTDAGHEFRIYDEAGKPVPTASIEMGSRTFMPNEQGSILIPYAEQETTVPLLLVDGESATVESLVHRREAYALHLGLLVEPQGLLAGTKGRIVVRPQLDCNGREMPLGILEETQLTIVTTDRDGIQSSLVLSPFEVKQDRDSVAEFLVPQRMASVAVTLNAKVLNESRQVRTPVSSSRSVVVNELSTTGQIADFYLARDTKGYRLQVRGRNGEPIARLPVQLQLKLGGLLAPVQATLATDAQGEIALGSLPKVDRVTASAESLVGRSFSLEHDEAEWPGQIYLSTKERVRLPWPNDAEEIEPKNRPWTLIEVRNGRIVADWSDKVTVKNGQLIIETLEGGVYSLADHRHSKVVEIRSVSGERRDGFIIGATQTIEVSDRVPTAIASSKLDNGKLDIQLVDADPNTRVHLIATTFLPDRSVIERFRSLSTGSYRQAYRSNPSFYIDSLKLDEEYQYILQRQYATKFSGNMLTQPSLLLNPWEIATTSNTSQEAQAGAAIPPNAADPRSRAELAKKQAEEKQQVAAIGSSAFEFLSAGAVVVANQTPDAQGKLTLNLGGLVGAQHVTVLVVHPTGITSKLISLPSTPVSMTDLRLTKSFDPNSHLAQRQGARILEAGVKSDLGDARSTRIQVYSSVGDAFRLYSTLLPGTDLPKFERLTRWHRLNDQEKKAAYNELGCHEVDLFLFHKDRPFFDKVVLPFLGDKFAPQLVDQWLLERSMDGYREFWQRGRLNAFERILLASRSKDLVPGTRKWFRDAVEQQRIAPEVRSQRFLMAMAGAALDTGRVETLSREMSDMFFGLPKRTTGSVGDRMDPLSDGPLELRDESRPASDAKNKAGANVRTEGRPSAPASGEAGGRGGLGGGGFGGGSGMGGPGGTRGLSRRGGALGKELLFQSVDQTREWAETQYYHVLLQNQNLALVPPGPFWKSLSERESLSNFLSDELHFAASNVTEALLALALLDLPLAPAEVTTAIENGRIVVTSSKPIVVFVESIEEAKKGDDATNLMVGQEIYPLAPGVDASLLAPVTGQALVKGVGYRASVVVTNPSSVAKTISVLTQVPQGAIPLQGGKVVQSHSLRLEPYSTQQLQYSFYYPQAGEFDHYGAQANVDGSFVASAASSKRRVLDQPENVDKAAWSYIAAWGTHDQVLDYLKSHNTQQVDLQLIAFRMQDKGFYQRCLTELTSQGVYAPSLWAYSVRHNDPNRIAEFLSHRDDWTGRLGPYLQSPLLKFDNERRYDFQHLDYRPLIVARNHQLGAKRMLLNERLHGHYHRLLERIAYQPRMRDEDRMSMTYYLLLQNRIDEAIALFEKVDASKFDSRLQYDYFDAYLDFYRGKYDRAAKIAENYIRFEVPRWRDLFAQIRLQTQQRQAMIDGRTPPANDMETDVTDPVQRLLVDARQSQQSNLAAKAPAIDLTFQDGHLTLHHQNVKKVDVRYYLMDIELLFSRSPFVQQDGSALIAIQPNHKEAIDLGDGNAKREMVLPSQLANRNVLVEVNAGALSQSQVVYANSMKVTVVDSFGQLQVTSLEGRPVEQAYVKVFARHQDGKVKFFKDGYTDLRGQLDYASLSTSDLQSVQRFSILVMHPERGALIREVAPPKR